MCPPRYRALCPLVTPLTNTLRFKPRLPACLSNSTRFTLVRVAHDSTRQNGLSTIGAKRFVRKSFVLLFRFIRRSFVKKILKGRGQRFPTIWPVLITGISAAPVRTIRLLVSAEGTTVTSGPGIQRRRRTSLIGRARVEPEPEPSRFRTV